MASLAITIIGLDRTGIINELAEVAAQHNANWVDSHMANIGGQFAGIIRLDVAEAATQELTQAFEKLESTGLTVVVAQASAVDLPTRRTTNLEILGQDRPGIVRDISAILNEHGVSIEELETEQLTAPVSGEKMFKAHAKLYVPDGLSDDDLNEQLQTIANDITVDVVLEA